MRLTPHFLVVTIYGIVLAAVFLIFLLVSQKSALQQSLGGQWGHHCHWILGISCQEDVTVEFEDVYSDMVDLKSVLNRSKTGYVFCHLNVRSIFRSLDEIRDLIGSCEETNRLFLSFSETWL